MSSVEELFDREDGVGRGNRVGEGQRRFERFKCDRYEGCEVMMAGSGRRECDQRCMETSWFS